MNRKNRCPKCMCEKEYGRFCPYCGYDGARQNSERALPVGTVLNEKYMIGAVIGEGGFGITYAAWDMLIGTRIAIKEYFPSELVTRDTTVSGKNSALNLTLIKGDAESGKYQKGLERFVEEAQNLAKFQSHPGVVSVKEFFYVNHTAYIVMEYIEGITLNAYLHSRGETVGVEETFRMMSPVMKTLEEIHREGVIHRDISPDNIMVTTDGQLKLIDFGAARFVGVDDEKSLTVMLKHGYAPEEQYRSNGEQGPWTDVYALSAVIYRMLTGKVPEEILTRMMQRQDYVHIELGQVPGLSDARKRTLEKGLAIKADARIRTVGKLYRGIYEEKLDIRKWAICAAAVTAVAVLVACFVFLVGQWDTGTEASFDAEMENLVLGEEGNGEKETATEEMVENVLEEPEYVMALREYYNENYLNKRGNVWFADMTGDGEDEMIVTEILGSYDPLYDYYSADGYVLKVYQCQNDTVTTIYKMEQSSDDREQGIDYYLYVDKKSSILARHWEPESCDGPFDGAIYKTSYFEKISFQQTDNGMTETTDLTQEESSEPWRHSLLLIASSGYTELPGSREKKLGDYQDVLEIKKGVSGAIEIAESVGEAVVDYGVVYEDGIPCIFAIILGGFGSTLKTVPATVWALYDGNIEKVELLNNRNMDLDLGARLRNSDIFQFGNNRHYVVRVAIETGRPKQHKFCFENGQVREIDHEYYFFKDENGKIQADGADMFYYDGKYVEYAAEQVDNDTLEQFENYNDILQLVEEEFKRSNYVLGNNDYVVERVELDHIRKTANGVYYLNYRVYASFWGRGVAMHNSWAHAVLETKGSQLEFKGIVWTKKEEDSGLGFPVYYGPGKELKPSRERE